jgi:hypothetical protein
VDRGVIATAAELFEARHYPSVIALITDALENEADDVALLLLRARSHMALRRDLDAQADLRDIIRLDPQSSLAYRLLGELAARRDENESAAIFFREALRLDPGDREAADWLLICDSVRPAAVVKQLPAPSTAAGRFSPARGPVQRGVTATDARSLSAPARTRASAPRMARGTEPPTDDAAAVTSPFAQLPTMLANEPVPLPPPPVVARGSEPNLAQGSAPNLPLRAPKREPAPMIMLQPQPPLPAPAPARPAFPETPGFGEYLVESGILTRERLRAAQAYQRSMKVQLSTAIVTLGLATPQRIEWAAVAHQSTRSAAR